MYTKNMQGGGGNGIDLYQVRPEEGLNGSLIGAKGFFHGSHATQGGYRER
jgi:hypothetical protein